MGEPRAALHQALLIAASELFPAELVADVLRKPREAVRPYPNSGAGDLQFHAPVVLLRRLRGDAATKYPTAATVAAAIVDAAQGLGSLVVHVQVQPSGLIVFTSIHFNEAQRAAGMLQCEGCGKFCSGFKGLRHHQQIVHGESYERAIEEADKSQRQLMLYQYKSEMPAHDLCKPATARASSQVSLVIEAAKSGDLEQLDTLHAAGHPVTVSDRHGSSPLLWAAGAGHLEVCRRLVETYGVSAHTKQRDGRQALHWAARNGHLEVCRWLVEECGSDPDAVTKDGTTAFHWAVWQGQMQVCKWLIGRGINWRSLNKFGCNAMQWAAQTSRLDMCRFLVHHGLDAKLCNNNGHSSLHKAAVKGQRKVCTWLIREIGLGHEHMRADQDGNTPSEMARLEGHMELAQWLKEVETTNAQLELDRGVDSIATENFEATAGE